MAYMKITSIQQQQKRSDRYSIFVDGKYAFSLSESALLESKLIRGQELSNEMVAEYKKLSADDKLYSRALQYVAMRPRTQWEIQTYLERKQASPALTETILNKLRNIDLIHDEQFTRAFVADRRLLRPTSRRKIIAELRKKHVEAEVIEKVLNQAESHDETIALHEVIARKRRQAKYKDNLKLMQYLARQGFNYSDIKAALQENDQA